MRDSGYLYYLWGKLASYAQIKAPMSVLFALLAYLFDPLETNALVGLFILVVLDFLYGIAAAKKTGEPITSAKVRRSAIKTVVYFSLVSAAHLCEYALNQHIAFLDETVTAFLAATELISIMENIGRLGYAIPKKLLNQLQIYTEKS